MPKIILTGSTGFIGHHILTSCIKSVYIDHIYSITRQPIPIDLSAHAKVTSIVLSDFETWPPAYLQLLREAGVIGCIWCVGGAITRFKDHDEAMAANVALPVIAAEAFLAELATEGLDRPFRFVYLSVAGAEQDQLRGLWARAQTRKMKGAAERALFEVAEREGDARFEVYCLRLGRVLEGGQTMGNVLTEAVSSSVTLERVAKKSLEVVMYGCKDGEGRTRKIVENAEVLGEDWAEVNALTM